MVTALCCLNSRVNHSRRFGGVFYHLHCLGNVEKILSPRVGACALSFKSLSKVNVTTADSFSPLDSLRQEATCLTQITFRPPVASVSPSIQWGASRILPAMPLLTL